MTFDSIRTTFNKCSHGNIYLEDENGTKLDFFKDKYVKYITRYIEKEHNYLSLETVFSDYFFQELSCKLNEKNIECLSKKYTSYKSYKRIESVLCGKRSAKDAAEMKRCLHFVKDIENFFDIKLLCNPEDASYKINMYLNSLVLSLLELLVDSDFYYYIPKNKKSVGYKCYWNQLKMIENNIAALYENSNQKMFGLWMEIVKPFLNIVGVDEENPGGDYPGINSEIWISANPNLKYFDCVYEVAQKDYKTYEEIALGNRGSLHFSFDIGKNEREVKANLKSWNSYRIEKKIRTDFEAEKRQFYIELVLAYKKIVKEYMHIDIDA